VLTQANDFAARRAKRLLEVRALRDRVRALMADKVERYSAQVADQLGLDVVRCCPRVAYVLKVLEAEGLLKSRRKGAPRSGLGRRYYRWASTVVRDRPGADGEARHA